MCCVPYEVDVDMLFSLDFKDLVSSFGELIGDLISMASLLYFD